VLCDVGSDITELIVLRNGIIEGVEIMPFGAGIYPKRSRRI